MKRILLILLFISNIGLSQELNIWNNPFRYFNKTNYMIISEQDIININYANEPFKSAIDSFRLRLLDSLNISRLSSFFKQLVISVDSNIIIDLTGQTNPYIVDNVDYIAYDGWYHSDTSVHGRIETGLNTLSWTPGSISFGILISQNYNSNKEYDMGAYYAGDKKIMIIGNVGGVIYAGIQSEHTALQSVWYLNNPTYPMILGCTRTAADSTADSILVNNGADIPGGITYYEQHPIDTPLVAYDIPITCLNYKANPTYNDYVYYSERKIGGWWFGKRGVTVLELRKINNCFEWWRQRISRPLYFTHIQDTISSDTSANRFITRIGTLTTFNDSDRTGISDLFIDLKDSLGVNDISLKFKRFCIYAMQDSIQSKLDWTWHNTDMATIGTNTFTPYVGWTTASNGCLNTNFKPTLSNNPFTRISNSWGIGVNSNNNTGFCFGVILSAPNNSSEGVATRLGGYTYWYSNATYYQIANSNSVGSYFGTRTDTSTTSFYKNGVIVTSLVTSNGAGALMDFNWFVGNMNDDGSPYATGYTQKQYLYDFEGASLSTNDARKIYNCLKKYFARKGITF